MWSYSLVVKITFIAIINRMIEMPSEKLFKKYGRAIFSG